MSQPLAPNLAQRAWANRPTGLTGGLLPLVVAWLGLRSALSLGAALSSAIRPVTGLEQAVALWPPTAPLGAWLERVTLSPWLRWDVEYFLVIAMRGYRLEDGTAQFHPLYPWLGRAVGLLSGNTLLGLLLVSSVSGLLALVAFERLGRLDLRPEEARRATVVLAHSPLAFILFAPYSEALFLMLSILTLLMARRQRWWAAGLAGGLAVLTRQQGLFLALPLLWELWEAAGRDWRSFVRNGRAIPAAGLVPAGLLVWLGYRGLVLGDVAFDLSQPRTLIYSFLISDSSASVVPIQGFLPPWEALSIALSTGRRAGEYANLIDLGLGALFALLLVLGGPFLWRLRPSYLLYSLTLVLVSFSYYTGPDHPYMGLPRHCFLAVPLFFPLARPCRHRGVYLSLVAGGVLSMLALVFFYTIEAWVP